MLDLTTKPQNLVSNWTLVSGVLETFGPAHLQPLRQRSISAFERAGIPSQKVEEFKYLSLRELEETDWQPAYGAIVDRRELEDQPFGKIDAITVTFVNGEYAPELSSEQKLPDGVYVGTMADAWDLYPSLERNLGRIATLEGRLGTSNDERFVDLNTAFLGEGAFVYVGKGVALETPIHLQFVVRADHGAMACFPRVLIVMEAGSEAKVIESYLGLGGRYFTNPVTEVLLERDAILEHTKIQMESPEAIHIATIAAHQEGASTFTSNNCSFGAKISRNDLNVFLDGEHTETWLNGATLGLRSQVSDNHTRIDHLKPNCHSFEVYKSVLADESQGVFNGKIFVYADAQKTDAKQSNQAILLSPKASINTKPQLEIFADDVKCTHGATVGQLREDAMFYLRSRGIPQSQAKALLVYAFVAEVIERVSIPALRETLERVLFERLQNAENLPTAE
jgi:Fe-S cluster assembly protein SufD